MCACECSVCRETRLRAKDRAESDRREADWMRREKDQARIQDFRDTVREYNREKMR